MFVIVSLVQDPGSHPGPMTPSAPSREPAAHLVLEEGLRKLPTSEGKRFVSLLKRGTLDVELYAPRGTDPQKPHTRDEVYVVAKGSGVFYNGRTRRRFAAGDLLFVAAGVDHRFEDFTADLAVWVLFYGPEGGEIPAEAVTA